MKARGKIKIAVSSCLLGNAVRYDGQHALNQTMIDKFADSVCFMPLCPEVGIGMGTPRRPIQLVKKQGQIRAIHVDFPKTDFTGNLLAYIEDVQPVLLKASGYIFKKDSPSCGVEKVKLFDRRGVFRREGVGLFAQAVKKAFPFLPVIDESYLEDEKLTTCFFHQALLYDDFRRKLTGAISREDLMNFHRTHRLVMCLHNQSEYLRIHSWLSGLSGKLTTTNIRDYQGKITLLLQRKSTHRATARLCRQITVEIEPVIDRKSLSLLHTLYKALNADKKTMRDLISLILLLDDKYQFFTSSQKSHLHADDGLLQQLKYYASCC